MQFCSSPRPIYQAGAKTGFSAGLPLSFITALAQLSEEPGETQHCCMGRVRNQQPVMGESAVVPLLVANKICISVNRS